MCFVSFVVKAKLCVILAQLFLVGIHGKMLAVSVVDTQANEVVQPLSVVLLILH